MRKKRGIMMQASDPFRRWITLLLVLAALPFLAACDDDEDNGDDEPTPTPTVELAEATDTPAPEPSATPSPPEPTDTPLPPAPTALPAPTEPPPPLPDQQPQACHPSYQGACLDPNASDYDCAGGSGNGPLYTGPVTVVGHDVFDLDRDGDGLGCE